MPWNLDSSRPIYLQIIERVQMDIITGRYQPGDKLPSVRDLAQEAAVNPNTMQKALSELERSGLIYSQRTSGRFITEDKELIHQMKKELAEIKSILKAAEKHIDGEEIDRAFVDRYISDITVYPDEEITRFEIHLKAGTTVTKTLQNLTSRAGSNSKKMIKAYEESMK